MQLLIRNTLFNTETHVTLTGELEEQLLSIIAGYCNRSTLCDELFIIEDDLLIPFEEYIYEPQT